MWVDVLRTLSLALLTGGLIVFIYVARKTDLIKVTSYKWAMTIGVLAWLLRVLVLVDSFMDLPDRWFEYLLPIWFSLYGIAFLVGSKEILAATARSVFQERVAEEVSKGLSRGDQ